jgi:hypothetical protein
MPVTYLTPAFTPRQAPVPQRRPVILVLSHDPRRQTVLEHRCAELGYTAVGARATELGSDALLRVQPAVALVDLAHPAAESRMFIAQAMELGTRVVLLGDGVEGPRKGGVFAFGGGLPPVMSDPVEDGLAKVLASAIGGGTT